MRGRSLRIIATVNVAAALLILYVAAQFGSGFTAGPWTQLSEEIQLVPVGVQPPSPSLPENESNEARRAPQPLDSQFQAYDLTPRPWQYLPDGRVRLSDSP